MKKLALVLALVAIGGVRLFAQSTGSATVSSTIANVLVMTYVSAPTFVFDDATDYNNGMTVSETGAITVTSNLAFDISVQASSANLTKVLSTDVIPVSNFTVNASGDGGNAINALALSASAQNIVDEAPAANLKSIDLTYATAGGSAFLNKETGNYTVTLTYTAAVD